MTTPESSAASADRAERSRLGAWFYAIRPKTLGAAVIPVLVGSSVAEIHGLIDLNVLLVTYAAALLLQIGTNLLNDAADFVSGVDTAARRGPVRVTQAGWLSQREVYFGFGLVWILAMACGVYLIGIGGVPILLIGLLSLAAAVAYSIGPFRLAAHGLGEIAALVFFGLVAVTGSAYLQTGRLLLFAVLASVPVGVLVSLLMLVNNLRDIETDAAATKRTLAVRLGERRTRWLYVGLIVLAYAWPFALVSRPEATLGAFIPWLSLPLALSSSHTVLCAHEAADFNRALGETALLHAVYGVLLAVGILW